MSDSPPMQLWTVLAIGSQGQEVSTSLSTFPPQKTTEQKDYVSASFSANQKNTDPSTPPCGAFLIVLSWFVTLLFWWACYIAFDTLQDTVCNMYSYYSVNRIFFILRDKTSINFCDLLQFKVHKCLKIY